MLDCSFHWNESLTSHSVPTYTIDLVFPVYFNACALCSLAKLLPSRFTSRSSNAFYASLVPAGTMHMLVRTVHYLQVCVRMAINIHDDIYSNSLMWLWYHDTIINVCICNFTSWINTNFSWLHWLQCKTCLLPLLPPLSPSLNFLLSIFLPLPVYLFYHCFVTLGQTLIIMGEFFVLKSICVWINMNNFVIQQYRKGPDRLVHQM